MKSGTLYQYGRIWILAARPKTLAAGIAPVLAGTALALQANAMNLERACCCLFFAIGAQIAANLANDGLDFCRGEDVFDRSGPDRAAAQGWLSPRALFWGAAVALALGGVFGLALVPIAPVPILACGLLSALFAVLYSGGPKPLSHLALGDLLVVLFFGMVAVGFTAFVQVESWHWSWLWVGLALGLAIDNILVVNNYRDVENDRACGKNTLIVLLGPRFGRFFYLVNGLVAAGLVGYSVWSPQVVFWLPALLALWLFRHGITWWALCRREDEELNPVLAETGRNVLLLALILLLSAWLSKGAV